MSKRANNEGTIFYREDRRRWVAQVSISGRRLIKYGKTQRECRDWIKETLKKIGNGLTFEGTQVTLEQFTAAWLAGKKLAKRAKTFEQYNQVAKMHILPLMGKMRLKDIQPAHMKQLYLTKQEEGRGARTVQLIHTVIHAILEQAMKEGILGRNPADAVEKPKVEQAERNILSEEQARRLIIASEGGRLGELIYLALMTGMREGELLGLRWADVEWEKGQLHIRRQLQPVKGGGFVFNPPKTKAGTRKISLGQATLDRLAAHRREQELIQAAMGERWEGTENLIFPNTLGKPWDCTNMIEDFRELLRVNGLPAIRFHDLRHTSISFLLDMGMPVNTIQQRAGHSKASVTTDTYGHSMVRSEAEAAERIEELITPVAVKLLSKRGER